MNELLRTLLFLPPQATALSRDVDQLHYFVILTTMGGAVLVTLVGTAFVVRYRRRPGEHVIHRKGASPPLPLWAEVTAVGGLLGLFMLWWLIGFRQYVHLRVSPEGAMPIYVTAKQWMWKFAYPEGHHTIAQLYVPAGRPVRLIMTSRDVIHSFFVPDFRVKQDVLPGRYTTAWFEVSEPGKHIIFCTEYCGTGHSTMRGEVIALSPDDFARWVTRAPAVARIGGPRDLDPAVVTEFAPAEPLDLIRLGEQAAAQHGCLRCHTTDGSPHIGPTWAGLYHSIVPLADGKTVVADEAYLTESIMDPLARIHRGYQPVMPTYLGLIRPAETAALLEYMKSLQDTGAEGHPHGRLALPSQEEPTPPGAMGQPPATLGEDLPAPGFPEMVRPEQQGTPVPANVFQPAPLWQYGTPPSNVTTNEGGPP